MRLAKLAAILVFAIQAVAMINILLNDNMYHGVGNDFFNFMFKDYWGTFISLDLMTGLLLFSFWLAWRESGSRLLEIICWIWNILWWGNIVVAVYILVAAYQSRESIHAFFCGNRSGEPLRRLQIHGLPTRALSLIAAAGTAVWLWSALDYVQFKGVPAFGLYAGFPPLIMAFLLMAFPRANVPKT